MTPILKTWCNVVRWPQSFYFHFFCRARVDPPPKKKTVLAVFVSSLSFGWSFCSHTSIHIVRLGHVVQVLKGQEALLSQMWLWTLDSQRKPMEDIMERVTDPSGGECWYFKRQFHNYEPSGFTLVRNYLTNQWFSFIFFCLYCNKWMSLDLQECTVKSIQFHKV